MRRVQIVHCANAVHGHDDFVADDFHVVLLQSAIDQLVGGFAEVQPILATIPPPPPEATVKIAPARPCRR